MWLARSAEDFSEFFVDGVDRKAFGIEAVDPVPHVLMIFVVPVGEGLQHVVEAGDSAAVFRGSGELSLNTEWIRNAEFGRQDFLNGEHMFPGIAQVVDISRLGTHLVQQIRKACFLFVEGERSAQEPLVWIRNAKSLLANLELMQVAMLPAHRGLHDIV